jgi:hypothetical protein
MNIDEDIKRGLDEKRTLDLLIGDAPEGHIVKLDELEEVFPEMRDKIRVYQLLGATFGRSILHRLYKNGEAVPGTYVIGKVKWR